MRVLKTSLLVGLLALGLSACGTTTGERALSGAGVGAAVGGVAAAVTGGDVSQGAVIGASAGAATGAATDEDDLNLGD
ncbi:YMGG-like glycine zipper-containing protein [Halomonas elongata]|uniref:YMGG-like glycine zipper-containing protein n=1 Tax=Halomonas elongata TaxID=2746 RepID=UPI0038D51735